MHSFLYRFASNCVEEKIIAQQELDWLVYGLERRITSTASAVFFLIVGIYLANALSVITFMVSFYFLRVRTNGYHANSFVACLFFSLVLEMIFLKFVLPIVNLLVFLLLNFASLFVIFLLAPFANRNMHLNEEEFKACRKSSRIRISALFAVAILLYTFGEFNVSKGITLGITMTALLLIIAYIKDKGEGEHEKSKQNQ